jgi:DNA helicase II / ATP-dependent DNA helicase PcrA
MKLTDNQQRAINSNAARIKVLAVAGSGKTTVLTKRVKRLIREGVDPDEILILTFTRKMAKVLSARVGKLKWVGTFHALCFKMIEIQPTLIGYKKVFMIDENERKDIVKNIIENNYLKFKNQATLSKWLADYYTLGVIPHDHNFKLFIKLYSHFMKKSGLLDFDMVEYFVKKVIASGNIVFKHVIIDEYQDTSIIEKQIVDLINPPNIFIVGDVFQNIYAFRGTTIENIVNFKADEEIGMSDTFRCPIPVTDFANSIIDLSSLNYPYRLVSKKRGAVVDIINSSNFFVDLKVVIDKYLKIFSPDDFYILTRTNQQVADIKAILEDYPVEDVKGALWRSQPMSQFSAFLRMSINLYHNYGVERFVRAMKLSTNVEINLWKVEARRQKTKLLDIVKRENSLMIQYELLAKRDISLTEKAQGLLGGERYDNLNEIYELIQTYEDAHGSDPIKFINWLLSNSAQDNITNKKKIKVMTMHVAKGLENKVIILPFIEDGIFPNARAPIEEELRLMYVAATRAEKKLIIIKTGESIFA